jgi:hypothetical protein
MKIVQIIQQHDLSEGQFASVSDPKDYDPDNIEVQIHGVGVYTLSQLKNRLKQRLQAFADNIDSSPQYVERTLDQKNADAFMYMLKGYNEVLADLETPQNKRKRTIAMRKKPVESVRTESLIAAIKHAKEGVPFTESLFRYASDAYFETIHIGRMLNRAGLIENLDWESAEIFETSIGEKVRLRDLGEVYLDTPFMEEDDELDEKIKGVDGKACWKGHRYKGREKKADGTYKDICVKVRESAYEADLEDNEPRVVIGVYGAKSKDFRKKFASQAAQDRFFDHPDREGNYEIHYVQRADTYEAEYQGKDVELNKPKRGGSKKYYVYTKNPKTGKVIKISFGDPGLKTKSGNKKRAANFAARHNCEKKNDRTKAGYWACRLPRYGLVKGGKWW